MYLYFTSDFRFYIRIYADKAIGKIRKKKQNKKNKQFSLL